MSDQPITLEFLARQQTQVLTELGTLRDDVQVLTAIVQRLDGTLSGAVAEIRAMHAQYSRLTNRVRLMEEKLP